MEVYEINPEEVIVSEERHRKHFDKGASVKMQCSLRRYGQLQPGVCRLDENGKVHLIAGERRLRGCIDEKIKFKYVLLEEVEDALLLEELELEENIAREDLTWQEECLAKERVHKLKQERYGETKVGAKGGHTLQDTADSLGVTKGLISQDIELAMWVKEIPEVADARNKSEAKKIVKRMKESVKRSAFLKKAIEKEEAPSEALVSDTGPSTDETKDLLAKRISTFSRRSLLGDFDEKISNFKDESIDVVIFDPPWGVGLDKVFDHQVTKSYEDTKEGIFENLPKWLEVLYGKMREDSHLYLFFGIVHFEFIYRTLEDKGFTTNRMPIIWRKRGAHRTRAPEVWPGRCYEAIAYARKGNKKLAQYGRADVIETLPPSPKMKKEHPSAKHPLLYVDLLERSCSPGDVVLDPMSGSGMFGVACDYLAPSLHLDWWMIEKDKGFHELGLFNLVLGFDQIISTPHALGKERPEEKYEKWGEELEEKQEARLASGFQSLEPGTSDWKAYWKKHPEEQDAMLKFAKERRRDD